MRTLSGIALGALAALLIVAGVEWIEASLYPLPVIDSADLATLADVVADMPMSAKLLTVLGWPIGAFGGAWLGLRVCDRRWVGMMVVTIVISTAIIVVTALPHPLWMKVCAIVLPVAGGALAFRAHRKPYAGEALLG